MIPMPITYTEQMDRKGIGPCSTLYRLPSDFYHDNESTWYYTVNQVATAQEHGSFEIKYALRSFSNDSVNPLSYAAFYITTMGIYVDTTLRNKMLEPIEFRDVVAKFYQHFTNRDLLTLYPGTKKLLLLRNVRYTEIVNGHAYPNTWFFEEHKDLHLTLKSHKLLVESCNYKPIELEWNEKLYKALRFRKPYIWVDKDNYIPLESLRLWNQNF